MRVVIQKVSKASVTIRNQVTGKIGTGLMILLGIEESDTGEDIEWLTGKISRLRIFADDQGIMNLSVKDINGEILVISQFTLHASTKKGNRPSYIRAAPSIIAIPLYELFVSHLTAMCEKEIQTGEFGAMMKISLINEGPVTIIIDSKIRE
jgi:D-tyrosyl-tRNA(Tyr) deacylase